MSCCGKAKRYIDKATRIASNLAGHTLETRTGIRTPRSPHTKARIQTCRRCEFVTCLKVQEYVMWQLKNAIQVLPNFDELEKLPPLPEPTTGKNLYCTICKCHVPSKARTNKEIKDLEDYENCPKGYWVN